MSDVPDFVTEIVCILDRSYSMEDAGLCPEVISGYNEFIKEQRELGPGKVTLILFDDHYETVYEYRPLATVPKLTDKVYYGRGMTALNDAVGRTINNIRHRHKSWKPEKTVVLIITDGQENASQEFKKKADIKAMVEVAETEGWEFFFLGANVDSFAEGASYGFQAMAIMDYDLTDQGVKHAFAAASGATSAARSTLGATASEEWKTRTSFEDDEKGDEDAVH